jgi:hypothetical protein
MPIEFFSDKMDVATLGFMLLLIVFPGLVAMRIYRLLVATRKKFDWHYPFYEPAFWGTVNALFAYLLVNFFIFSNWIFHDFIIYRLLEGNPAAFPTDYHYPMLRPVSSFVVLTATAMLLPLLWIFLRKREFVKRYILQQDPTAWDFYFAGRRPCFVLVRLKNGNMIGGYFGRFSYASMSPDKMSIYLEKQHEVDDNGKLGNCIQNSHGVVLCGDEIVYLEFFNVSDYNIRSNAIQKENKNEETKAD